MSGVLERLAALPPARGREEIVDRLFELFREQGYEGASLSDIARITGLKRPSLYHYFPGGKAEMARAVAALTQEALAASVLAPLEADVDRAARVRGMLEAVRALYGGGWRPCVVASLLVGEPPAPVATEMGGLLRVWIDRLAAALVATGATDEAARRAATDAVVRIQGALVVSRALGTATPFEEALAAVEAALLDRVE